MVHIDDISSDSFHYYRPFGLEREQGGQWKLVNHAFFREGAENGSLELSDANHLLCKRLHCRASSRPAGWTNWAIDALYVEDEAPPKAVLDLLIYDSSTFEGFRPNSLHQVFGIVFEDDGSDHLSAIHVISSRLESRLGAYLIDIKNPLQMPFESVRHKLLSFLSNALGTGTQDIALILLLHLLSRVINRRADGLLGSLVVGPLSLNLIFKGHSRDFSFVELLEKIFGLLTPAFRTIQLDLERLEKFQTRSIMLETENVHSSLYCQPGLLQIAPGTRLIIDETGMAPGKLSEKATRNLQDIIHLAEEQQFRLECGIGLVDPVNIDADLSVLVVSSPGRSIVPCDWHISFSGNPTIDLPSLDHETINLFRRYIEWCRSIILEMPFIINQEMSQALQDTFVQMRQDINTKDANLSTCKTSDQHNNLFTEKTFGKLLNLARLITCSYGQHELTNESWREAVRLYERLLY